MIVGNELQADWLQKASELSAEKLNKTLVIAPHPDDESLGCGGTIALLRDKGIEVYVLFVSDGSMSHPNSKKYPAKALMQLRESEALQALQILNVPKENCTFLRLKDGKIPTIKQDGFYFAVTQLITEINKIKPATILVPWQKDPHTDHRASWNIVNAAVKESKLKITVLQYFIWVWALAKEEDLPTENKFKWSKINIESVLNKKQAAINAHISQTTNLIDDDPHGFTLSPEVLNYFKSPFELFVQ